MFECESLQDIAHPWKAYHVNTPANSYEIDCTDHIEQLHFELGLSHSSVHYILINQIICTQMGPMTVGRGTKMNQCLLDWVIFSNTTRRIICHWIWIMQAPFLTRKQTSNPVMEEYGILHPLSNSYKVKATLKNSDKVILTFLFDCRLSPLIELLVHGTIINVW